MRAGDWAATLAVLGLASGFGVPDRILNARLPVNPAPEPVQAVGNGTFQSSEQLHALHEKCLAAGERLQGDVDLMVPNRTWMWRTDAARSRQHLAELQRHLKDFWDAEAAFEAGLSPAQRSKFHWQFAYLHQLFRHLQGDAQSLDTELQRSYPTRWHVAHDVTDMGREINRWKKMHRQIAAGLGLKT